MGDSKFGLQLLLNLDTATVLHNITKCKVENQIQAMQFLRSGLIIGMGMRGESAP
jgi:hypothetical protein